MHLQLKFIRHLENQHVVEQDYATFECEVTKGRIPVDWYHNGAKIIPNPKYQVGHVFNMCDVILWQTTCASLHSVP